MLLRAVAIGWRLAKSDSMSAGVAYTLNKTANLD
jgi:hypothetical protein